MLPRTRGAHLFQVDCAEFQFGLLGDAADGADGEVVGGIAFAVEIAPVERDEDHSRRDAAAQAGG